MLLLSIFRRELTSSAIIEIVFWLLLIVGITQQIISNGEDFVNKPSLIRPAYTSSASSQEYGRGAPIQLNDINIRKDKEK
ncbi:hypothetical protein BCR32DRAFT_55017 [Anaeromyces robustus]|uniref:Uncharacterized protein n=1 Tax=Anaeromyces robustus TaxID=1754192 RepID=A0A1Y1XLQ7_9FUNG|nr:hypothetical protein BCR32DRAFT_55017 [Anaeromyces robustus]|eukprot:ORX86284.1 hypothetical protein BCR32DRAFT_55017 [Anaeromyces robustus]